MIDMLKLHKSSPLFRRICAVYASGDREAKKLMHDLSLRLDDRMTMREMKRIVAQAERMVKKHVESDGKGPQG